ncbi:MULTISPECIES: GyrI-like domain-containing protein [unclassified Legionella]|uniref:GyrI-like domain-containing protein n=1 Tax=unclassified Legionella TaxID=2622702 RepID=UPI001054230A|nr:MULTISPECIES: GyrI-like domain-containing protein [unclassified Legionella]MDI9817985.1 GyrI-like domain-containing protein [Legionella sp. PL877]
MRREILHLPELTLIGISTRTNNKDETNPEKAKILPTLQYYFQQALADKIPCRAKPATTYCVYTDYESDEFGDYTYFVGELVREANNIPEGFCKIIIPSQRYAKFTSGPDAMPGVCINAWQEIWQMSPADMDGARRYLADFEVYDERSSDPHQTELDIYIGIQDLPQF